MASAVSIADSGRWPSDTPSLRRYTIVLAATWHRIRHPRGACALTMLQLVLVRTAETILSPTLKIVFPNLAVHRRQAPTHASVSPLVLVTRGSAQPKEHGSVDQAS